MKGPGRDRSRLAGVAWWAGAVALLAVACGSPKLPASEGAEDESGDDELEGESGATTDDAGESQFPPCEPGILHIWESVEVTSQAELDELWCAWVIHGTLTISAPDIVDLAPLEHLGHVWGGVEIHHCEQLTSLHGLEGFEGVHPDEDDVVITWLEGMLHVHDNPVLVELGPLDSLEELWNLHVHHNEALVEISGVSPQSLFYTVDIHENPSLERIAGFDDPANSVNELTIRDNLALLEIDAFDRGHLANVHIHDNPALLGIDGFHETDIVGNLAIHHNASLISLTAFEQASRATYIKLMHNPALSELGESFGSVAEWQTVHLCRNPSLSQLWPPSPAADPPSLFEAYANSISAADLTALADAWQLPESDRRTDATPISKLPLAVCPFTEDFICDEASNEWDSCQDPPCCVGDPGPTGLCAEGTDLVDCLP